MRDAAGVTGVLPWTSGVRRFVRGWIHDRCGRARGRRFPRHGHRLRKSRCDNAHADRVPDPDAEPLADAVSFTDANSERDSEPVDHSDSDTVADAESLADAFADTDVVSESDSEPVPEPVTQRDADSEPDAIPDS
jgi:hypothetical protein